MLLRPVGLGSHSAGKVWETLHVVPCSSNLEGCHTFCKVSGACFGSHKDLINITILHSGSEAQDKEWFVASLYLGGLQGPYLMELLYKLGVADRGPNRYYLPLTAFSTSGHRSGPCGLQQFACFQKLGAIS